MEENGGSLTDGATKEARTFSTGRLVAGETRRRLKIHLRSGQEAQDSESLWVLCDNESENFQHGETCGSDIEHMQPLAEDDVLPDVSGGILDLRPTSQQGKRWNLRNRKDQREMLWLIRTKRLPELCHRIWPVHTVLHSLVQGAHKERSLVLARPQWPCIAALSPVHDTLGVQA